MAEQLRLPFDVQVDVQDTASDATPPAQVLITAGEVAFATAAAKSGRGGWRTRAARLFGSAGERRVPQRRARRMRYLENALLSREMDRL